MFKIFQYVFLICMSQYSFCFKNNVCPTIEDYSSLEDNPKCEYDIAADKASVVDVALHYGYLVEEHKVITKDKYVLKMFRLSDNQSHINEVNSLKQPVLLQHAWSNSALNFFGRGKDSLPFLLFDAGYDVWLGNFRGNEYAEEHLNFTVFDSQFWNYTIDDLAAYDTPTQLDHVLETISRKNKIIYIGYSLGTTTMFMYCSTHPQICEDKVKLAIMLAPVSSLQDIKAPLFRIVQPIIPLVVDTVQNFGLMRLLSQTRIIRTAIKTVCTETPAMMNICLQIFGALLTGPYHQTNFKTMPVLFNQVYSGISVKILGHIAFLYNGFTKYDYGIHNLKLYGSKHPPAYEESKIIIPTLLFYAPNDYVATIKGAQNLYNNLNYRARYGILEVQDKNFNHFDFMYGSNVKSLVYERIIKIINND